MTHLIRPADDGVLGWEAEFLLEEESFQWQPPDDPYETIEADWCLCEAPTHAAEPASTAAPSRAPNLESNLAPSRAPSRAPNLTPNLTPNLAPRKPRTTKRPPYNMGWHVLVKGILASAGSAGLTAEDITEFIMKQPGWYKREWTKELKNTRAHMMSRSMDGHHWTRRKVNKQTRYFSMQAPPDMALLNQTLHAAKRKRSVDGVQCPYRSHTQHKHIRTDDTRIV